MLSVTVIEVCNTKLAGRVLEIEEAWFITPFMSVRFSVYQSGNYKVMVTLMNSEMMQTIQDEMIRNLLIKSCSSADKLLEQILK